MMKSAPDYVSELSIGGVVYDIVDLHKLIPAAQLKRLPYSIRLLIENVCRCTPEALPSVLERALNAGADCEVPFKPNRLMFHDTTCLPALADFAGMRDLVSELGGDPRQMNPMIPAVLAIDHSVIVESYGNENAVEENLDIDFRRNSERYRFIKWAQRSLDNFNVIPPGTGIIHQMNMEVLARAVWETPQSNGRTLLHPDDMVATDSHTPMVNGIGVLAWGVGGLEGQAALVGEPVPINFPKVIGIRVSNQLRDGVTATDLALLVAQLLRQRSVVGKFVEFTGPGLASLSWAARSTVANMAPEYGATTVFFPFDAQSLSYLRLTARTEDHCQKVERFMEAQPYWRDEQHEPDFDELIEIDLATVEPSMAGPYQPHQKRSLSQVPASFRQEVLGGGTPITALTDNTPFGEEVSHGAVVIAAITSCTNTANPALMLQAGLFARNARAHGLHAKPWVKTSLSPGSRTVADYLQRASMMDDFSALGFDIVGFGCMTCIGNSGSLEPHMEALADQGLKGVAVLSGNRNFEGRVNPKVPAGYLASPALCIAYAIAGRIDIDLWQEPLGYSSTGEPVYFAQLMPGDAEVAELERDVVSADIFRDRLATVWDGTHHWAQLSAEGSIQFPWSAGSTYLRRPQYLEQVPVTVSTELAIKGARALMVLGDNVTTDHISPAGAIPRNSLAGQWLIEHGEDPRDLNQYSTRRSNHEVMLRGAFTNKSVKNRLITDTTLVGGWAWNPEMTETLPVYLASKRYLDQHIPTVIFAGINYGAGSSRDWAAKAQALLGVKAVVAHSFERIHRSNLIGMGILPLVFTTPAGIDELHLQGDETFDFEGLETLQVGENSIRLMITRRSEVIGDVVLALKLDSSQEVLYLKHGGVLPYVVRKVVSATAN